MCRPWPAPMPFPRATWRLIFVTRKAATSSRCGAAARWGSLRLKSAYLLGADRVVAIDNVPERLQLAAEQGGATVLKDAEVDVSEALKVLTGGRGPDACIDAVGLKPLCYKLSRFTWMPKYSYISCPSAVRR
jgi:hypothetical protein